ncbi:MAG: thioesterase family protein [Geminicoccaceae bacterium]|nr:acyl-CoA thioesterase [Geminicoccaceae bacterium]
MFVNRREVVIEWGDCDPAGIVFYPRYFAIFNQSTGLMFEAATGMTTFDILRSYGTIGWPMVDTRARFFIPSRYDDRITIETRVVDIRHSSFDIGHKVTKGGHLAIEAMETRVWSGHDPDHPQHIRALPLPQPLRDALMREAE